MRFSIITATLNSGQWMAECAGSVIMQNNRQHEVEHVIADGGSTDDTVEIAKRYGCTIAPRDSDDDIFTVITKAVRYSSGDVISWLGSDDCLLPGAINAVARRFELSGRRWVTGSLLWTDQDLRPLGTISAPPEWVSVEAMASLGWCYINDRATFTERSLFEELDGLDPNWNVCGDLDYFLRAMQVAPYAREPQVLAAFRRRGNNMSIVNPHFHEENDKLTDLYGPPPGLKRQALYYGMKGWVNARNPLWSVHKLRPGDHG
jgi:glycosyltransferase involved in cell wall biosynthesis